MRSRMGIRVPPAVTACTGRGAELVDDVGDDRDRQPGCGCRVSITELAAQRAVRASCWRWACWRTPASTVAWVVRLFTVGVCPRIVHAGAANFASSVSRVARSNASDQPPGAHAVGALAAAPLEPALAAR